MGCRKDFALRVDSRSKFIYSDGVLLSIVRRAIYTDVPFNRRIDHRVQKHVQAAAAPQPLQPLHNQRPRTTRDGHRSWCLDRSPRRTVRSLPRGQRSQPLPGERPRLQAQCRWATHGTDQGQRIPLRLLPGRSLHPEDAREAPATRTRDGLHRPPHRHGTAHQGKRRGHFGPDAPAGSHSRKPHPLLSSDRLLGHGRRFLFHRDNIKPFPMRSTRHKGHTCTCFHPTTLAKFSHSLLQKGRNL